jgi:hypothetical protein
MLLFDDIARAEQRPRRQNEGGFDYLNTSARPGVSAIRSLLESWFEHLPDIAKSDVRGRFRSREDVQHRGAFFELYWHELLLRSGYEVEIHPPLPHAATNPDFLARRNKISRFYLEATLASPAREDCAADSRLAEFHDVLDRMESPDFFLHVEYRGSPKDNIRGRPLRERLERWLGQLDVENVAQLYRDRNHAAVPVLTLSQQGVLLTFTPIPKGPETRGRPGVRPVGIMMPMEMQEVRTQDDIRAAVEGKATKYGDLDLPLTVAVNVIDDYCDDDEILNALFGEQQVLAVRQPNGTWIDNGTRELRTERGAAGLAHAIRSSVLPSWLINSDHRRFALAPCG